MIIQKIKKMFEKKESFYYVVKAKDGSSEQIIKAESEEKATDRFLANKTYLSNGYLAFNQFARFDLTVSKLK